MLGVYSKMMLVAAHNGLLSSGLAKGLAGICKKTGRRQNPRLQLQTTAAHLRKHTSLWAMDQAKGTSLHPAASVSGLQRQQTMNITTKP